MSIHYFSQGLKALLFVALLFFVTACEQSQQVHELKGSTMGTSWSAKLVGLPPGVTVGQIRSDIELVLESINNQMSTYREDSSLSVFNASAPGSWHQVPSDLFFVVDYALSLARDTEGAYDPTVGPLVNLWGFGPERHIAAPGQARIEEIIETIGWTRLESDPQTGSLKQPGGLYLDLSSVAKGFAVDKLAGFLQARGFDSFLVEIGGELAAIGRKPDGSGWKIAVEKPVPGVREVTRVIEVSDMALATSGDYRNFFEQDGKVYSHTINPHTGYPVQHKLASVTVLHQSCMKADALATALLVMGPEAGYDYASARGIAALFMMRTDSGDLEQKTTVAMARLLGEASRTGKLPVEPVDGL